jgi:hypothetical protein
MVLMFADLWEIPCFIKCRYCIIMITPM